MKKTFVLLCLLFSSVSFAQRLDPFLGLVERYPIVYNDIAIQRGGAQATFDNRGNRIVIVSPQFLSTISNNVAGAVLQHEYCHHDMGHTTVTIQDEASADCCAAGALAAAGRKDVIEEWVESLAAEGCSYDPTTPLDEVNRSHPCGTQRAVIAQECARIIFEG
jgi:hypothetical protein